MTEEKKPKVLLVDDDKFLLDIYALKFKASGIEIITYSSSKEAMEKLQSGEKFDIIILDIIMPGIDGMEILKNIRQEKLCEGSAIIMLTNQADEVDKAKILGVDGYIIKATTIPSEVVETVLNIYKNKK
jgi:two-component system alkaline phosphatase synthesis response regulator PhoP